MAYNVTFLKGTKQQYLALTVKNANTFYYLDDKELYLGTIKLSNGDEIAQLISRIEDLETASKAEYKTTEQWESNPDYVPQAGALLIYSNYQNSDGIIVPNIKIGDGITPIEQLPFLSSVFQANPKLEHSLTIGDYIFDGTQDVTIPTYKGALN